MMGLEQCGVGNISLHCQCSCGFGVDLGLNTALLCGVGAVNEWRKCADSRMRNKNTRTGCGGRG